MDVINTLLEDLLAIDATTLRLMGLLTAISCWIIKGNMKQPILVLLAAPFIYLLSTVAYCVGTWLEILSPTKVEEWMILVLLAHSAAALVVVLLMVVWNKLRDARKVGESPSDAILFKDA